MKAIADICVIPIGVGKSLGGYVARCEEIFRDLGLEHRLHAYGTNVEGEWDTVMEALKRCHEEIHGMGAPRVATTVRIGTRIDREQTMQDKIDSVQSKLS